jgi:hypothetical protein
MKKEVSILFLLLLSLSIISAAATPANAASVQSAINEKSRNLKMIENKTGTFNKFLREGINLTLDLPGSERALWQASKDLILAKTEQDYRKILNSLDTLNIPTLIQTTMKSDGIPYFPAAEGIYPEAISEVAGGEYNPEKEQDYKDAILAWNAGNIVATINFQEVSGKYVNKTQPIIKYFGFEIKKSENASYDVYIIIANLENLRINGTYFQQKEDLFYKKLSGEERFEFTTTEDVDFLTLPIMISPSLDEIPIIEDFGELEIIKKNWTIFVIVIVLLIIIGVTVYIILQEWYKKKYEKYLFKNLNDLYNLGTYIHTSKKKGMKNGEIEKRLKEAGWNAEQIRYAMRKYVGKRTGMPEIPIGKLVRKIEKENRLNQQELNRTNIKP